MADAEACTGGIDCFTWSSEHTFYAIMHITPIVNIFWFAGIYIVGGSIRFFGGDAGKVNCGLF